MANDGTKPQSGVILKTHNACAPKHPPQSESIISVELILMSIVLIVSDDR